jgi:hypothetical protein
MNQKPRKDMIRDELHQRQIAYTQIFGIQSPSNKLVLQDLKKFCRANSSTFHPKGRVHALLEGRREVILRIEDFLTLTLDELCVKYGGNDVPA